MTAPELTAEEREIDARFEAAPYPPEVAVALLVAEARAVFGPAFEKAAEKLSRIFPGGAS